MRPMSPRRTGFTLVEILIIAPFAILLIGSLIFMATQAANSSLRSYGKTRIQNDVLAALDLIEQDIRSSVRISSTSSSRISLEGLATNINPLDADRKLIDRSTCALVDSITNRNDATRYELTYQVTSRTLVRATSFTGRWCRGSQSLHGNTSWQKHGASESIIADADINLTLQYDTLPGSSTSADAVRVTLTATRRVGGQNVSHTGKLYIKSINI